MNSAFIGCSTSYNDYNAVYTDKDGFVRFHGHYMTLEQLTWGFYNGSSVDVLNHRSIGFDFVFI